MMGRREVGFVRDLSGQKVTTSPISHYPTPVSLYPIPVFSLSYALKNHKKAKLISQFKEKQYLCPQLIHGEYIFI